MKGKVAWASGALGLILVGIQVVPVDRRNPAVESEVPASPEVRTILHRACYDCHSNETVWPWYSRIAPLSWLIAHDVHEGRDNLNLSTWNRLGAEQRVKARQKAWKEVVDGEMPPWRYVSAHPQAGLSSQDKTLLHEWLQ
jgi:hypothetical protein